MRATAIYLTASQSKRALSLLFLGGDAFSIGVLKPLLASKADLWSDLLVVTSGEKQIGRGSKGSRRIVRELLLHDQGCTAPLTVILFEHLAPLLTYAEEQGLEISTLPATGFKDWQVNTI